MLKAPGIHLGSIARKREYHALRFLFDHEGRKTHHEMFLQFFDEHIGQVMADLIEYGLVSEEHYPEKAPEDQCIYKITSAGTQYIKYVKSAEKIAGY